MKIFSVARRDGNLESAKICLKLGKSMQIKMNQVVLPKSSPKIMGHGRSKKSQKLGFCWSEVNITSVLHRFMRHTFAVASDINGWLRTDVGWFGSGIPIHPSYRTNFILELPCSVGSILFDGDICVWHDKRWNLRHIFQADQSDSKSAGGNVFESFWWVRTLRTHRIHVCYTW